MWTGPAKFPIRHFDARGKFVDEQQNGFLAEMSHPEWKEPEKLDALRKAGAKFGSENKEAFLKSVPADVDSHQFSGCRLNLGIATFGADYGWVIQGTHRWRKKDDPCHANFEPFEGKLVGIDEL